MMKMHFKFHPLQVFLVVVMTAFINSLGCVGGGGFGCGLVCGLFFSATLKVCKTFLLHVELSQVACGHCSLAQKPSI